MLWLACAINCMALLQSAFAYLMYLMYTRFALLLVPSPAHKCFGWPAPSIAWRCYNLRSLTSCTLCTLGSLSCLCLALHINALAGPAPSIAWRCYNLRSLTHKYRSEREGFEPSIRRRRIHAFQACSFNHSDISPDSQTARKSKLECVQVQLKNAAFFHKNSFFNNAS